MKVLTSEGLANPSKTYASTAASQMTTVTWRCECYHLVMEICTTARWGEKLGSAAAKEELPRETTRLKQSRNPYFVDSLELAVVATKKPQCPMTFDFADQNSAFVDDSVLLCCLWNSDG
jgi:hypothetical protein